ncbi:hypothetical protein T4E_7765 [Trichinella pseudospiralis]|uniref:Uncharacterized protein n=1 Tax=Trichinella pseudospiralis TaxID=6337 RepID=A0A0V0XF05_TRIPS|nr:hypothetical protein T4E_7765 [Trichinella pseudospiralis]
MKSALITALRLTTNTSCEYYLSPVVPPTPIYNYLERLSFKHRIPTYQRLQQP